MATRFLTLHWIQQRPRFRAFVISNAVPVDICTKIRLIIHRTTIMWLWHVKSTIQMDGFSHCCIDYKCDWILVTMAVDVYLLDGLQTQSFTGTGTTQPACQLSQMPFHHFHFEFTCIFTTSSFIITFIRLPFKHIMPSSYIYYLQGFLIQTVSCMKDASWRWSGGTCVLAIVWLVLLAECTGRLTVSTNRSDITLGIYHTCVPI